MIGFYSSGKCGHINAVEKFQRNSLLLRRAGTIMTRCGPHGDMPVRNVHGCLFPIPLSRWRYHSRSFCPSVVGEKNTRAFLPPSDFRPGQAPTRLSLVTSGEHVIPSKSQDDSAYHSSSCFFLICCLHSTLIWPNTLVRQTC